MKKVIIPAAAVISLGLGGFGIAQLASADPGTAPDQTTSSSTQGNHGRGKHGPRFDTASLAKKLGVEESKLKTALDEARTALRPTAEQKANGERPDRAAMEDRLAGSLSQSLGIDKAKVSEALQAVHDEKDAQAKANLKSRLDQAVTDGKLTQSEADAVVKASDAGLIGPGSHR